MADAVHLLSDYVRIRTDHPQPDYRGAVDFLKSWCERLFGERCKCEVFEYVMNKPNLIVTITGQSPNIILLSSHMDVVPVEEDKWTCEPFSGEIKDGHVIGRGSQDMKCVGVGYIAAVHRIVSRNARKLKKTIKLVFTVDEEIGSADGMARLADDVNAIDSSLVDVCLDEGAPSPYPFIAIFNGERYVYCIKIAICGQAGHASAFLAGTVGEKLSLILARIYETRTKEMARMACDPVNMGAVMTINVTRVEGGVQFNVVPGRIDMDVSIRCPPFLPIQELTGIIESWIHGIDGISWTPTVHSQPSPITDHNNAYLEKTSALLENQFNIPSRVALFPGASDSRFLRSHGVPCINVTPIMGCPLLMHDHDERVPVERFLRSIDIYERIIDEFMNL